MHTPLQIRERNALRDLVINHPIYLLVKDMVLELDEQCLYFHLTPEDVFLETIDLVDGIRETSEEQPYDIVEHCKRIKSLYRGSTSNPEAKTDIELWTSIIIYTASSALSIVKTKPYKSVASHLRNLVLPQYIKLLLPYLNKAILQFNDEQFEFWDQYFFSENFLSVELITAIENADYCSYIQRENIVKCEFYTLDWFETELKKRCQGDAPGLVDFLQRNEKLGYLYFGGDGLNIIYDTLRIHFPDSITYGYAQFASAAKAINWHSRKKNMIQT